MLKGILLIAFLALVFSVGCSSQFYFISLHAIEINVDAEGNAQVSERFFLQFQNPKQLYEFREKVKEIGVSLDGWKAYDSRLRPYIGQEDDITASKVAFVENNAMYLEITYALKAPLFQKTMETSRVIEYAIKPKFFNKFLSGGLLVIPQNTAISINLPPGAELLQPIEPEASVSGNSVTWRGYKHSKLTLNYRVFKQIASFDLNLVLRQLLKSNLFWVVIAIIVAVAAVLFWNRRTIVSKIENYIVEHSDLSMEEEK